MSDARQSPLARLGWIINVCFDQVGTVFFGVLIIATIKQKRLHNTCQLLIGIYAFCSLLSKLQILLPFAVFILPGTGKIPRIYCALVQIIPIGGCMNVFSLMLVIAIDRMLAIFSPIWYSTRNEKKYLKLMCALSQFFPLIFVGYVIRSLIEDPFLQVQCFFPDIVGDDGQTNIGILQLVLNFLTLFCYVLMFLKLFYDNKNGQASPQRKAVYKTLSLIMGIQLAGYTLTLLAYNIMNHISSNFNNDQKTIINCVINCASSLSSTVEVPALFVVSTEHRLAIKDEFRCFFSIFSNSDETNKNNTTHHTTKIIVKPQNKTTKMNNFVKVTN